MELQILAQLHGKIYIKKVYPFAPERGTVNQSYPHRATTSKCTNFTATFVALLGVHVVRIVGSMDDVWVKDTSS